MELRSFEIQHTSTDTTSNPVKVTITHLVTKLTTKLPYPTDAFIMDAAASAVNKLL